MKLILSKWSLLEPSKGTQSSNKTINRHRPGLRYHSLVLQEVVTPLCIPNHLNRDFQVASSIKSYNHSTCIRNSLHRTKNCTKLQVFRDILRKCSPNTWTAILPRTRFHSNYYATFKSLTLFWSSRPDFRIQTKMVWARGK